MADLSDKVALLKRLTALESEVRALRAEIEALDQESPGPAPMPTAPVPPPIPRKRSTPDKPKPVPASPHRPPTTVRQRPATPRPSALATTLDRYGLKPPSGSGNLEVQVGTWWATRVGALLAIICVVFFGVYVSQNAAPWVRFVELLGVSLGITIFGRYVEKRQPKFGGVVFAAGLALIYFTAYAAYGVRAVRVLNSETIASLVQFAAVLLIVLTGMRRRSDVMATMATVFGYVTCFFSLSNGLDEFALTANLLLAAGAVFFYVSGHSVRPVQVAVPLTYLIYAALAQLAWIPSRDITFVRGIGHPLMYLILFGTADLMAARRKRLMTEAARQAVQILNSTAAVGLGFLFTYTLFRPDLGRFYFLFGAVLLVAAMIYYARQDRGALMHAYLVKAVALIAMGLIVLFGGWVRWIALAIQSLVLVWSARRTGLRLMAAAMGLVWLASAYYFVSSVHGAGYHTTPALLLSRDGLLSTGYLLLSALVFGLRGKWLGPAPRGTGSAARPITAGYAALVGVVGIVVAQAFSRGVLFSLNAALAAIALGLVAALVRNWVPVVAATVPLAAAHVSLWLLDAGPVSTGTLLSNGLLVVLLTIAVAGVVCRLGPREQAADKRWLLADGVLHALWLISLQVVFMKLLAADRALLAGALSTFAVALYARYRPFRVLSDLSPIPLVIAAVAVAAHWMLIERLPEPPETSATRGLAALFAFGFAVYYARQPRMHERSLLLRKDRLYQWLHVALAAFVGWHAVRTSFAVAHVPAAATLLALALLYVSGRTRDLPAMRWASLAYLAAGHFWFHQVRMVDPVVWQWAPAWTIIAASGLTLAYALLLRRFDPAAPPLYETAAHWACGALALAMLFTFFDGRRGVWANYVTVFWGLSAITVFLLGFADRSKPLRLLGMIGLAICIPRVFIVDIRSTLYRIAAFGVLGAVLLLVGFLYHKYRDKLERADEP